MTNFDKLRNDLLHVALSANDVSTGIVRSYASRPGAAGPTLVNRHADLTVELSGCLLSLLGMGIEGALPEARIDALLDALAKARAEWRQKHAKAEWDRLPPEERRLWLLDSGAVAITAPLIDRPWEELAPVIRIKLANRLAGEDIMEGVQ